MTRIRIPAALADAVQEDDLAERLAWLEALPDQIAQIASEWSLVLGEPYEPGGQCAWVAPASDPDGAELALKLGWRHRESAHEADALRLWDGDGAVRCHATASLPDTTVLLLERCTPGTPLRDALPEPEHDSVIAALLARLWTRPLPAEHPFGSLAEICAQWAAALEISLAARPDVLDPGLAREALATLRELPLSAGEQVLLCTDLHAGNVLAARREPWLVVDPKPFVGDPCFDVVQHMLNCDARLAANPVRLGERMAALLDLDARRVKRWLFARCAQEAGDDETMRAPARALARTL